MTSFLDSLGSTSYMSVMHSYSIKSIVCEIFHDLSACGGHFVLMLIRMSQTQISVTWIFVFSTPKSLRKMVFHFYQKMLLTFTFKDNLSSL